PTFDPDDPRTMPSGFNVTFPYYFAPAIIYADSMKHAGAWTGAGGSTIAVNGTGDLTSITGGSGTATRIINRNDTPNGFDARGYPSDPEGTWTLKWDGADTQLELVKSGDGTLTLASETLTGTTDNVRTYTLTHSTN